MKRLLDGGGSGGGGVDPSAATAEAAGVTGADVIEEGMTACRAACKSGDPEQCGKFSRKQSAVVVWCTKSFFGCRPI